jgi:hypothetical protein
MIFQADLRVGRRSSSDIFQKALELELRRDTAVDALGALPSSAPQRVGSGSLALNTGTATAATGTPLHRMPSHSVTVATVATSSAATAPLETFQSEDLRWDRTVSESDGDSRRVRVIVDDLAMAPKSNTGVRPVLEFLRQFLETGLGSAQEHWERGSLTCSACWSLQTSHNANGG